MKIWLAFIPFLAFLTAFGFGVVALWFIAKRAKILQTETKYGKALHVESPIGTLDVHAEAKLDPRLASIAIYPGAMAENSLGAQSVSEVHFGNRTLQEISASYWTPDSQQQVWEFYRQQLPNWPRNPDEARGKELIRDESDCVLLVRITRQHERTVIEMSIKPAGYPNLFERRLPMDNRVRRSPL